MENSAKVACIVASISRRYFRSSYVSLCPLGQVNRVATNLTTSSTKEKPPTNQTCCWNWDGFESTRIISFETPSIEPLRISRLYSCLHFTNPFKTPQKKSPKPRINLHPKKMTTSLARIWRVRKSPPHPKKHGVRHFCRLGKFLRSGNGGKQDNFMRDKHSIGWYKII